MLENLPDALGHLLRDQRAGLELTAFRRIDLRGGTGAIKVTSLAFVDHAPIPEKYTADGAGVSPSLQWSELPADTASAVLLVDEAVSPTPQPLVHAIVVGLAADESALAEAALPSADNPGAGHHVGLNSFLQSAWLPPDPPPGHGVHRYAFQVFALGAAVDFADVPGREAVLELVREHGIASGCLIGTYQRHDTSVRIDDVQGDAAGVTIAS
jgi:Raf kinase inhibitor-like YbhB/YbcL family protein